MKKVAFVLAGLLAIMLAGCGEGSSSAGGSSAGPTTTVPTVDDTVSGVEADLTTPQTPLEKLSMGAPPGLPN